MGDSRLQTNWKVRATAGEPFAVVRVKNLQTVIRVSKDAWGRLNSAAQPLLISAEVSFVNPFETAASDDKLGTDTVHYGNLSKAILAVLEQYKPASLAEPGPPVESTTDTYTTLDQVINKIWVKLTSADFDGWRTEPQTGTRSLLDPSRVRFLSVSLHLPKASLLGEGVGLAASSVFETREGRPSLKMLSRSLCLRNLRVPTLIGVNDVERQSKQFVVATIELDKFGLAEDIYTHLESLVITVSSATRYYWTELRRVGDGIFLVPDA